MKVLFIYPNAHSQLGFNYGVSHMSAVLKQAGHAVDLWQLCEDIAPLPEKSEFIDRIKKAAPDIVGFSVVTNQWPYAQKLAKWTRMAVSVPIVCGGVHTLANGEDILKTGLFDYIVRGEAENSFLDLVNALGKNKDVSDLKNVGMIQNGKVRLNPVGPLPGLRELPFKDYDIFDFQKMIDAKDGWVGLMASRGCPFSCSYCFNHQMVKIYKDDLNCNFNNLNYIRHFGVGQMISEIEYLLANYKNIRMFIFDDDLFTFYSDYVDEFCREYKKVTDLPFVVNAHVGHFDEERATHLAGAGCKIVKFGVESGSPRIRKDVMQRHMKNETIVKAIRTAKDSGLHTSVFLMIGLPGETHEDVMATINLMSEAMPGRFRWTFFFPFPGTKAYDIAAEKMQIDYDKIADLENFTDRSCLDFGEDQNLFLKKVGLLMPWFVNAGSDLPSAGIYRKKVDDVLALDSKQWEEKAGAFFKEDKKLSEECVRQGLSHYAIKYNRFMGVISDYFLNEH